MRPKALITLVSMFVTTAFAMTAVFGLHLRQVQAGQESAYTVLEPIRNGSLRFFR